MREFLNMATGTSGGASLAGAATGQLILAVLTFILFAIFGCWGAWLKWKDSKAINEALKSGDLAKAIKVHRKEDY